MRRVVFYSWMSTPDSKSTNRYFIEEALTAAAKSLSDDPTLGLDIVIDQDARDESGSPDIANVLFDKLDRSHAVVADISIYNAGPPKPSPNPNVSIELGYAAARLGWDRVILVFNEALGNFDTDRPFDIRNRYTIRYTRAAGEGKAAALHELTKNFERALREVLLGENSAAVHAWLKELAAPLLGLPIVLDELDDQFDGWARSARLTREWSDKLRVLAANPICAQLGLDHEIAGAAELSETWATELERKHAEDPSRNKLNAALVSLREKVISKYGDRIFPLNEARNELRQLRDATLDLHQRRESLFDTRGVDHVLQTSSALGERMLLLLNFLPLAPEVIETARQAARAIHLHGNGRSRAYGEEPEIVSEIRAAAEALKNLSI